MGVKCGRVYATTDIAEAFFLISLAAQCRPQFAFLWRGVQYTWNRLPQGWKQALRFVRTGPAVRKKALRCVGPSQQPSPHTATHSIPLPTSGTGERTAKALFVRQK